MGEAVDLANVGANLLLALKGVCWRIRYLDLLAVHGGDVRATEVSADAYDAALKPVGHVRSVAPCAKMQRLQAVKAAKLQG